MLEEIKRVQNTAELLHDEAEIESAIKSLAEKLNTALENKPTLVLSVMNGGMVFAGKLLPQLKFPCTLDAINASRYGTNISGGAIRWQQLPQADLKDQCILIVDDILDHGDTLNAIIGYCREKEASEIYSAVLVDKQLNKQKPVTADFIALQVKNRYLFGYGMDYKGYLRNAPGIYACTE